MSTKLRRAVSLAFCAAVVMTGVAPCFAEDVAPSPGPELEARQKLYERIQQAKSQGIGIGGYLQAYKALDEQVKAGDSSDKISSRVQSINKAVNDQMERAKVLKTQKPLPPQGSQINGSGSPAANGTASKPATPPTTAAAGGEKSDIVNKLKDKLDNIPDSLKERLMNDPSLLQKLKDHAKQ